jgi:hypothetical protein
MKQVSVNIPLELYKLLEEEAGNVPVEPYIAALLSRALRQRPRLVVVDSLDAFLQALEPWKEVVGETGMMVYGGGGGGTFRALPNGKVQITAGGWFWPVGTRIEGPLLVGELSGRFSRDGEPDSILIDRGQQTVVPWEPLGPGDPPLDDNDRATFERMNTAVDEIWAALERLGVSRSDRLMPET